MVGAANGYTLPAKDNANFTSFAANHAVEIADALVEAVEIIKESGIYSPVRDWETDELAGTYCGACDTCAENDEPEHAPDCKLAAFFAKLESDCGIAKDK